MGHDQGWLFSVLVKVESRLGTHLGWEYVVFHEAVEGVLQFSGDSDEGLLWGHSFGDEFGISPVHRFGNGVVHVL